MTDETSAAAREAAWFAYRLKLGNLTPREEGMIESAFKAGWGRCAAAVRRRKIPEIPECAQSE